MGPALRALLAARGTSHRESSSGRNWSCRHSLSDRLPLENLKCSTLKPGLLDSIVSWTKCRRVPHLSHFILTFNPIILPCLLPRPILSAWQAVLCCSDGSDLTETSSCAVLQKVLCSTHVPRYFLTRESWWLNSPPHGQRRGINGSLGKMVSLTA